MSRKPGEIAEQVCSSFGSKIKTPIGKVFLLAVLAGAYVGFGGYLFVVVSSDAAAYVGSGLAAFIGGAVFSLGLILIVLGGGELFTGNGLITVACLSGKARFTEVLKNWGVVYIGNLVGSLLLVGLVFAGGSYLANGGAIAVRAIQVANVKVNLSFMDALIRGILCNWLVCLAIWIASSAEDTTGKILAIIPPISAFVAMSLEHSVANMFLIPLGILAGGDASLVQKAGVDATNLSISGFVGNLIPVTLGNLIGGALFVAAAYWYIYLKDHS
ncbi:MAG: formate/nitrite transporter family protein [Candidatus Bathyarchaeota archaeon]|nr:formate/nitrite transporter family protein [Candidatus Bathyarchaeota archaeon]